MKLKAILGLALLAGSMSLAGCTTFDQIGAAYHVATSASITRNQAITLATTVRTLQDFAQVQVNSCVATHSYTGLCKPEAVEAIHKAMVAARAPRDALLAFADQHVGAQLGASGLYDALVTAKGALVSALQTYGYSVPAN